MMDRIYSTKLKQNLIPPSVQPCLSSSLRNINTLKNHNYSSENINRQLPKLPITLSSSEHPGLNQEDYLKMISKMKAHNDKLALERTALFRKNCQLETQITRLKCQGTANNGESKLKFIDKLQKTRNQLTLSSSNLKMLKNQLNFDKVAEQRTKKYSQSVMISDLKSPTRSFINTTKQSEYNHEREHHFKIKSHNFTDFNTTKTNIYQQYDIEGNMSMRVPIAPISHQSQKYLKNVKELLKALKSQESIALKDKNPPISLHQLFQSRNKVNNISLISEVLDNKKKNNFMEMSVHETDKHRLNSSLSPNLKNKINHNSSVRHEKGWQFKKAAQDKLPIKCKDEIKIRIYDLSQKITKVRGQNKQLKRQIFH